MRIWDAADYFISKVDTDAGENITHLKLQKLLYYAQAWHLALYDEPLFDNEFQAWVHGPVCPEVFQKYRGCSYKPLPYPEDFDAETIDQDHREFLDQIWDLYGRYDAKFLERLTHQELPWRETRKGIPDGMGSNRTIKNSLMRDYYRSLLEDEE